MMREVAAAVTGETGNKCRWVWQAGCKLLTEGQVANGTEEHKGTKQGTKKTCSGLYGQPNVQNSYQTINKM